MARAMRGSGASKPAPVPSRFWADLRRDLTDLAQRVGTRLAGLPAEPHHALWPSPRNFCFGRPVVDFVEDPEAFRIVAELPGLTMGDVSLSFRDRTLTIRGEKRDGPKAKGRKYFLAERSFGRFERSFYLPRTSHLGRAEMTFEHGVLTVTLLKSPAAVAEQKI